ncbi:E3 ubiquitin-protein ligase PDZRN3-like isoform X3 [Apostichopus japonicus]|uniref:E3 ubiquitin-protein ligase PDZRN3-like isoform X3 n=1 Tax=Stichopus japonicus TaxID=307972 RepID=UPI003AB2EA00
MEGGHVLSELGNGRGLNLTMDFIIQNVNGKDLSKASHEEAVEAFKNATEPIIVQVLRRTEDTSQVSKDKMVCNAGTQTELQSGDLLWKVLQTYQVEKSDSLEGLCEITPQEPLTTIDTDLYDDLDAMDNLGMPIIDEDDLDRAFDFEYEDVTLKRINKDDKLGLTLCYGGEDGDGGIFISEIESASIAAEDDRLREGDQILQINGEDVENREQALKLFSEQRDSLALLVCRPQYQLDDCLLERGNALLDELQMDMLEQTHQEAMQYTAFHHYQNSLAQDDDGRTDTTGTTENNSIHHEKDSGVGRATDESVRNDSDGGEDGSTRKYPLSMNSGDLRYSNESFTSNELVEHELHGGHGLSVADCQKFQAALESKCDKHVRSDTDESYQGKESKVMRLGSDSMDTTSQSGDSLNRPAKLVGPDSEHKLDSLIESIKSPEEDVWLHKSKPGVSPSLSTGSSISDVNVLTDVLTDVTSMSSTVSGPLDSNKLGSPKRKHSEKNPEDEDSSHISLLDKTQRKSSQGSASRQHRAPRTVPGSPGGHRSKSSSSSRERPRSSSSSGSSKDKTKENKDKVPLEKIPPLSSALPYPRRPCTNPHIRAQILKKNPYLMQQVGNANVNLFSQNLKLKHQNYFLRRNLETMGSMQSLQSVPSYAKHYRSYMHLVKQNEENLGKEDNRAKEAKEKVATEWKVKIRSDGTRYITRKTSTRDRVLKDRENKLREERCGLTTDDEAVSEMKLGKYWSREDRKKHFEKARDQKRRREFMHRARMECLQEQAEDESRREPDIVELSRKKMLKRKGRKLMLDDFTTVQEMLVHATKGSPDSSRDYNPLLNVTMV